MLKGTTWKCQLPAPLCSDTREDLKGRVNDILSKLSACDCHGAFSRDEIAAVLLRISATWRVPEKRILISDS